MILQVDCTSFGSTYTKIGTIQRRLAWPLRKDDTQIREAFHIFFFFFVYDYDDVIVWRQSMGVVLKAQTT